MKSKKLSTITAIGGLIALNLTAFLGAFYAATSIGASMLIAPLSTCFFAASAAAVIIINQIGLKETKTQSLQQISSQKTKYLWRFLRYQTYAYATTIGLFSAGQLHSRLQGYSRINSINDTTAKDPARLNSQQDPRRLELRVQPLANSFASPLAAFVNPKIGQMPFWAESGIGEQYHYYFCYRNEKGQWSYCEAVSENNPKDVKPMAHAWNFFHNATGLPIPASQEFDFGKLVCSHAPIPNNQIWNYNYAYHQPVPIAFGAEAAEDWQKIVQTSEQINTMAKPYGVTPYQNLAVADSNTFAYEAFRAIGENNPKPIPGFTATGFMNMSLRQR